MIHTIDIKVRGYHIDLFGHVNNARYLEFLEEARWAVFDNKLDLDDLARDGFAFTVVNINISYRNPSYLNDILSIETSLVNMGNRSATLRQSVKNNKNGQPIVDAEVIFVMLDVRQQKAALLTGELKKKLIAVMA